MAGATNRPAGRSPAQTAAACVASKMAAALGSDACKPLECGRCLTVVVLIVSLLTLVFASEWILCRLSDHYRQAQLTPKPMRRAASLTLSERYMHPAMVFRRAEVERERGENRMKQCSAFSRAATLLEIRTQTLR